MDNWIDTTDRDRLPDKEQQVVIHTVYGYDKEATYKGLDVESEPMWLSHGCIYWHEEVPYWMPKETCP